MKQLSISTRPPYFIIQPATDSFHRYLNKKFSYKILNAERMELQEDAWGNIPDNWKHLTHRINDYQIQIPLGFYTRFSQICKNLGFNYHFPPNQIDLDRLSLPKRTETYAWNAPSLYDYQEEILRYALRNRRGIIQSATGSGKTLMFANLTQRLGTSTNIYLGGKDCITIGSQVRDNLKTYLGESNVGWIGAGACNIIKDKINIFLLPTAHKALQGRGLVTTRKKVLDHEGKEEYKSKLITIPSDRYKSIVECMQNAQVSIYDECDTLGASTYSEVTKHIPSLYNYGFSGTAWRNDNRDLDIMAATGDIIYNLSASQLIKQGYLTPLQATFYSIQDETTSRKHAYSTLFKRGIIDNETRNQQIFNICQKHYEQNETGFIIVNRIAHGKELATRLNNLNIPAFFLHGNHSGETRKRKLQDMQQKRLFVIVTTLFSRGVDLPSLAYIIRAKGEGLSRTGKPHSDILQIIGRVLRKAENKPIAYYYDFIDHYHDTLFQHSKSRIMSVESEPEFKIQYKQL